MSIGRRAFLGGASAAIVAGAAPRSVWGRTEADVIVIGAGLAGLQAAHLLEAAGQRVVVLEGSQRIGGRLHTLDDLPGRPEAGGIQVGSGYARLIAHAKRLGVPLIGGGNESRDALYWINEDRVAPGEWPGAYANRTDGEERAVPPSALGAMYARRLPALKSSDAWRDPVNIRALDRSWDSVLVGMGASPEARRLINTNHNGNHTFAMSALHVARSAAIFSAMPGPIRTIGGGSQRLPEAMAANLAGSVRLRHAVVAIAEERGGVTVRLAGGTSLQAAHAVCTIPFSAMRTNIAFDPVLPPILNRARFGLPYTSALFFYLASRTPFWREDGYPPTLWSDHHHVGRVFVLGEDPPMLKVWISGPRVGEAYIENEAANGAAVIAAIEKARPSARGQLRFLRRWNWHRQPFARGIYHHIGAGDGAMLAAATMHIGKRLHFAGEHLAVAASGMEGALESGERAARQILA